MSQCCCGVSEMSLVFSCSGSADVGELADHTGRKLKKDGTGQLVCLALLAAGSEGLKTAAENTGSVLVLDGCPQDCAKKCLEKAGVKKFSHLRVTDLGLPKGESPASDENLAVVLEEAMKKLGTSGKDADEGEASEPAGSGCACGGKC